MKIIASGLTTIPSATIAFLKIIFQRKVKLMILEYTNEWPALRKCISKGFVTISNHFPDMKVIE
jgi:hypothetical protein